MFKLFIATIAALLTFAAQASTIYENWAYPTVTNRYPARPATGTTDVNLAANITLSNISWYVGYAPGYNDGEWSTPANVLKARRGNQADISLLTFFNLRTLMPQANIRLAIVQDCKTLSGLTVPFSCTSILLTKIMDGDKVWLINPALGDTKVEYTSYIKKYKLKPLIEFNEYNAWDAKGNSAERPAKWIKILDRARREAMSIKSTDVMKTQLAKVTRK